jgi:hypothetical protein
MLLDMVELRMTHAGAVLIAAPLLSGPLVAAEKEKSSPDAKLPGVDGNYRIVKPAPLPEPDDAAPVHDGKYGNWDVTISGSFTTDAGVGKLPMPRN